MLNDEKNFFLECFKIMTIFCTECISWFNTSNVILRDQDKFFTEKFTVNILSEVFMKPTNIFFTQIIDMSWDIYQTIFETIFKISCHGKSNQALFVIFWITHEANINIL